MDFNDFIVGDEEPKEYLMAVKWLGSKIGNLRDSLQGLWVSKFQNYSDFESKLGESLFKYADDNGVDFAQFSIMVWGLMEDIYIDTYGTISHKVFTE